MLVYDLPFSQRLFICPFISGICFGASSECKKSWNFGYPRRMQTSAIESTPEKWQDGKCAGMFSLWRSWPRVAQLSGSSVGKKHVPRWIGGEHSGKMIRNKHVFRFIIMKLHRCPKMLFMVFWGWNDWGLPGVSHLLRLLQVTNEGCIQSTKKTVLEDRLTGFFWHPGKQNAKCASKLRDFFEGFSSNIFQHVAADTLDNSSARHATFRNLFSNVGFSENPSIGS